MKWDRSVEAALADGYDINYGARSIKYEVERRIINQLAAAHERGFIDVGSTVQISAQWRENAETPDIKLKVRRKGVKTFVDVEEGKLPKKKANSVFG